MTREVEHHATRILVTGATGYLGSRLVELAGPTDQVVPTSRSLGVDITDRASVQGVIRRVAPDAIVHAAAANPGSSADRFAAVNALGSANVAAAAAAHSCRLVHVSTDVVHSGTAAPYDDDDPPTPINDYGRSKAEAEAVVLDRVTDAVVVRTSLIYGLHAMDRGTASFVERLRRGERLELFRDVVRQPVHVDALCAALLTLATDAVHVTGRLNVVGSQVLTREEFGRRMLDFWGVSGAGRVTSVSAAGLTGVPLDLRMTTTRAAALGLPLPGVDAVLNR